MCNVTVFWKEDVIFNLKSCYLLITVQFANFFDGLGHRAAPIS